MCSRIVFKAYSVFWCKLKFIKYSFSFANRFWNMKHHPALCSDFQAYYVPGLGGEREEDSADPMRQLREAVFGSEFDKRCIEFIPNYNTIFHWLSGIKGEITINTIAKLAKKHTKNRCGKVSFILFGHSNGGEIAVRAFEHLKNTLPEDEFQIVKRCSAIFTFGSPKWMRRDLAKVSFLRRYICSFPPTNLFPWVS